MIGVYTALTGFSMLGAGVAIIAGIICAYFGLHEVGALLGLVSFAGIGISLHASGRLRQLSYEQDNAAAPR